MRNTTIETVYTYRKELDTMTEIEKIMSETKAISENIKANYTLETTA